MRIPSVPGFQIVKASPKLLAELVGLPLDVLFFTPKRNPITSMEDIATRGNVIAAIGTDLGGLAQGIARFGGITPATPKPEAGESPTFKGIPCTRLVVEGEGAKVLVLFPIPDSSFLASENVGLLISRKQITIPFGQRLIGSDTVDVEKTLADSGDYIRVIFQSGATGPDLALAARMGNLELVTALLASGASPNVAIRDGFTPLMLSVSEGHESVARLLLAKGADPNAKNSSGFGALLSAVNANHPGLVKALLAKGANANVGTSDGITPLMIAANKGSIEIAQALISSGANVNARTTDGKYTPLKAATEKGNDAMVQLLKKAGAKD